MGKDKKKVKKKCCKKYLKEGKHCKSCPLYVEEGTGKKDTAGKKKKAETKKAEKKNKKDKKEKKGKKEKK